MVPILNFSTKINSPLSHIHSVTLFLSHTFLWFRGVWLMWVPTCNSHSWLSNTRNQWLKPFRTIRFQGRTNARGPLVDLYSEWCSIKDYKHVTSLPSGLECRSTVECRTALARRVSMFSMLLQNTKATEKRNEDLSASLWLRHFENE